LRDHYAGGGIIVVPTQITDLLGRKPATRNQLDAKRAKPVLVDEILGLCPDRTAPGLASG